MGKVRHPSWWEQGLTMVILAIYIVGFILLLLS